MEGMYGARERKRRGRTLGDIMNPDGRMDIRANFYNTVDGTVIIDNTAFPDLHQEGDVYRDEDGGVIIPFLGMTTPPLEAVYRLMDELSEMGLAVETVAIGRITHATPTSSGPGVSTYCGLEHPYDGRVLDNEPTCPECARGVFEEEE